jgi:hypothetical protein
MTGTVRGGGRHPASLQGALMGTRPTLPVSEGIVARIALDQQDDPGVIIPGPSKSINPSVLLTF